MKNFGFFPTDILIPARGDLTKWSVVACDQYTSQPEYWQRVRRFVGDAPSTLKLMQPEAELQATDAAAINRTMREYLESGIFTTLKNSLLYVQRTTLDGKVREGLIGALDLECYDYNKGATTLCRATEGTVVDRLPPRIKIREGAPLEMPHIMVLIDDPQYTVIEALNGQKEEFASVYDFDLMEQGGHLKGYAVSQEQAQPILEKLGALAEKYKCAIVLIGHMNKAAGNKAAYRGMGSIDFFAVARSVLLVGRVEGQTDIRAVVQIKNNLAAFGHPKAFQLSEAGFRWLGDYEITADEVLGGIAPKGNKLEQAKQLLWELAETSNMVSSTEIMELAKEEGISKRTMESAKRELQIPAKRINSTWYWNLSGAN